MATAIPGAARHTQVGFKDPLAGDELSQALRSGKAPASRSRICSWSPGARRAPSGAGAAQRVETPREPAGGPVRKPSPSP